MATAKAEVLTYIQSLPDNITIEDIIYHLYVKAEIQKGQQDIVDGRVIKHAEVLKLVDQWLRSAGPSEH